MCFKCNGIHDANQSHSYLALESQCLHKCLLFKNVVNETLKLGFIATKSNNPIIPASNACLFFFNTLVFYFDSCKPLP